MSDTSGPRDLGDAGDLTDVAVALASKRSELEAELEGLSAEPPDTADISFGKRVGDGTSVAVERLAQVAAHDLLREMLADVRRAEEKLGDGSYGTCDKCGGPIAPDRLEALPWATRCIGCASLR
ncbi:MAG: TraR/DksA family transcriptional regulator [Actinomycetes bacterium]